MMTTRLLVVNLRADALTLEAPGVGVPGHGLLLLGLAQALEQPHPAPIGVQGIDVVDDDELIAVPVELGVHANGVALPSIQHASPSLAPTAPSGSWPARPTDQDHEMEVPLGEALRDTRPAVRRS